MKNNEIKHTVRNNFKNIEKNFRKMLTHFNGDDMETFRKEIKKLRSFFHLLDMEAGGDTHFRITPKMKTLYGYTGILRDLYLLLHTIQTHFVCSTNKELTAFIGKLEKEVSYWKKSTIEFAELHQDFQVDEDTVQSTLPEKLKSRSIKKFTGYLSYEIQTFLTRCNDDKLNSIEKLLEDVLYNWEYLRPYADTLPDGLRKEEDIRSLVDPLQDFRDRCAVCTVLDTYANDSQDEMEKTVLADIMEFCEERKEVVKRAVCAKLELIPVRPIVKRAFSL